MSDVGLKFIFYILNKAYKMLIIIYRAKTQVPLLSYKTSGK